LKLWRDAYASTGISGRAAQRIAKIESKVDQQSK